MYSAGTLNMPDWKIFSGIAHAESFVAFEFLELGYPTSAGKQKIISLPYWFPTTRLENLLSLAATLESQVQSSQLKSILLAPKKFRSRSTFLSTPYLSKDYIDNILNGGLRMMLLSFAEMISQHKR